MTRSAVGIDIGGSGVRVGLVDADGLIRARTAAPMPQAGDPQQLATLVARLTTNVTTTSAEPPAAVGVGLPGLWDRQTGVMRRAVNLPLLEGVNIVGLFEQALGTRIYVDADVNAATWAQWRSLSPRPERLVYVSMGTGVGGGVVLNGELVRHTHGGAGHFGFLIVDPSPLAAVGREGLPGSLSAVASRGCSQPAGVAENEPPGAPCSASTVQRLAQALAVALANLAHIYAPRVILLGGGVVDAHPDIVASTATAFARYRSDLLPPELEIRQAPLPSATAGLIGAALLAMSR